MKSTDKNKNLLEQLVPAEFKYSPSGQGHTDDEVGQARIHIILIACLLNRNKKILWHSPLEATYWFEFGQLVQALEPAPLHVRHPELHSVYFDEF